MTEEQKRQYYSEVIPAKRLALFEAATAGRALDSEEELMQKLFCRRHGNVRREKCSPDRNRFCRELRFPRSGKTTRFWDLRSRRKAAGKEWNFSAERSGTRRTVTSTPAGTATMRRSSGLSRQAKRRKWRGSAKMPHTWFRGTKNRAVSTAFRRTAEKWLHGRRFLLTQCRRLLIRLRRISRRI